MDYSHEIIAAHKAKRLGYLHNSDDPKREITEKDAASDHFHDVCRLIERSQKFDFTGLQRTFSQDLLETAQEAADASLLVLPYEVSFFNLRAWSDGQAECALVLGQQIMPSLWSAETQEDVRITVIPIWRTFGSWGVGGVAVGIPFGGREGFTIGAVLGFAACSAKAINPKIQENATTAAMAVMQCLVCLQAKGIKLEQHDPSRQERRRCEREGGLPPTGHSIVVIDPDRIAREPLNGVGTHASPRMHWRRGHIRTLASGRKIQVHACIVGDPRLGWVEHDYRVKPMA